MGLIKNPVDIFSLENKHKNNPPKIWIYTSGPKSKINTIKDSAIKLFKAIEDKKSINFDRFIYSLGIRHLGSSTASLLASHFMSLENMTSIFTNNSSDEIEEVKSLDGIGSKVTDSLTIFFNNKETLNLLKDLLSLGVVVNDFEKVDIDSKISGKNIVITGTLESMSRAEAKVKIESLGAKVVANISKKTDYLIAGNKPTVSKVEKAKELDINVLNENEMDQLLQ